MDPIKEYFEEKLLPTPEEIGKIFPTLNLNKDNGGHVEHRFSLYLTLTGKYVTIFFLKKKIAISLKSETRTFGTKIIDSVADFNLAKSDIINFIFCRTRKYSFLKDWNHKETKKDLWEEIWRQPNY